MIQAWADFLIVGVLAFSFLISLVRGFVKEILSLIVWILAFFVAHHFSSVLMEPLSHYIKTPSLQGVAAFSLLFILVLLLGALVNFFLAKIVHSTGLSGTDRLLGGVFGIARGLIIVSALVWLGQMTSLKEDPWWQQSKAIPHFQSLIGWVHAQLPTRETLSKDIRVNNTSKD